MEPPASMSRWWCPVPATMAPAVSNLRPSMPISTLKGDLTVSPFFRFLKNTLAPTGTGGKGVIAWEESGWDMAIVSLAGAAAVVSDEAALSPALLQAAIAISRAAGRKWNLRL